MPRSLAIPLALLLLAGCDDPAETVREVVDARGTCSEDSLRVSSETCVRMFEKYAEMVTGGIHTYIGGMKAMDRAIQRLPPANFDTVGLGRAVTLPRDALAGDSVAPRFAPASRPPRDFDPPYDDMPPAGEEGWYDAYGPDPYGPGAYGPDDAYGPGSYGPGAYGADAYGRAPREPLYDRPRESEQGPVRPPAPAPRRGVLLPPDARLRRPWLGADEPQRYPDRFARECEDGRARDCEEAPDRR